MAAAATSQKLWYLREDCPNYLNSDLSSTQKISIGMQRLDEGFGLNIVNIKLAKFIKSMGTVWAGMVGSMNARNVVLLTRGMGNYLGFSVALKLIADAVKTARFALSHLTGDLEKPISAYNYLFDFAIDYAGDIADCVLLFNPAAIPFRIASAFSHVLYGMNDITKAVNCHMKESDGKTDMSELEKVIEIENKRFHMINAAKAIFSIISSIFGLGIALHAAGKLGRVAPKVMQSMPKFMRSFFVYFALRATMVKASCSVLSGFAGAWSKFYKILSTERLNQTYITKTDLGVEKCKAFRRTMLTQPAQRQK